MELWSVGTTMNSVVTGPMYTKPTNEKKTHFDPQMKNFYTFFLKWKENNCATQQWKRFNFFSKTR